MLLFPSDLLPSMLLRTLHNSCQAKILNFKQFYYEYVNVVNKTFSISFLREIIVKIKTFGGWWGELQKKEEQKRAKINYVTSLFSHLHRGLPFSLPPFILPSFSLPSFPTLLISILPLPPPIRDPKQGRDVISNHPPKLPAFEHIPFKGKTFRCPPMKLSHLFQETFPATLFFYEAQFDCDKTR